MAIRSDNPIERPGDDALGRNEPARLFADQVLAFDPSAGLVVAVLGPWGSGKTSFLNLATARLKELDVAVLQFNPWMFSGAEQLVSSFFIELSAQLKVRPGLAEIGEDLEDYGEGFSGLGWLPLVGPWIERGRGATKVLAKILQRRKEGVGGRRVKLEHALRSIDSPIVVVLDDIDRLTTTEIRDVFKLVRLTANFPNIIYLLAFDRRRVEDALSDDGIPGRDYLEKILQIGVDLPAVPPQVLSREVLNALNEALEGLEDVGLFSQALWPDIYAEVIRPLLRNMRDVRRYAAAVHGTVRAMNGQIELADVLGLEAVRVFLPDVFGLLHASIDGLTSTSDLAFGGRDNPAHKVQIERLIAAAGEHDDVVRSLIGRLFLAAQRHVGGSHYGSDWKRQWMRSRRAAHEDVLRFYLERLAGEGLLSFTDAERAWPLISNEQAFDNFLRSLQPSRLPDVISSLEAYEEQFEPAHVVPGVVVLLNLLPDLPERDTGFFSFGTAMTVSRVTYRLLRSLPDEAAVKRSVEEILPRLLTLSSKLEVISDIGYRDGRGHKLVAESVASDFERAWRAEVRAADSDSLAAEQNLIRILLIARREAEPGEDLPVIDASPSMTRSLLLAAKSDLRSQQVDSRSVHRSARLAWDVLVELYGDETTLKLRIADFKADSAARDIELLTLVDRYLGGWRPSEFGDDH